MIHGRLATILATLEAWHAEEAKLTEKYKKEYLERCAAGDLKTDEEEAAFIERVNAELESKRRSFERLQVSVVAGGRNQRSLRNGSWNAKTSAAGALEVSQVSLVAGACNQRYLRLVERQIPKLAA